ncbi:MAG: FAD-dependent oxidoreductase [Betaproteobacteria bacterium]|nr:FAD-dependent oxidoreductase [Betaproteobacteria bacterium]
MPAHETRFLSREQIAEGTMAFRFAKPAGFNFRAGQSMIVTLLDPPETDAKGNQRSFSIASAPAEADLAIATRMRDTAFKRVLKAMPEGTRVQIRGPAGSFVLDEGERRPAVFIAGGIGITPFVSMLRQSAIEPLERKLYLLYSNRRPEDAAFMRELMALEQRNSNYRIVVTMSGTEEARESWNGERGRIDKAMLERTLVDLLVPVYYVAGPPAMLEAMQGPLAGAGVKTEDIRCDEFFGY